MGVKMVGVKQLKLKLEKNMKMEAVRQTVRRNGAELQTKAQRYAPVKTGTLKRSIRLDIQDNGLTARTDATADYAPYVEWGTRFMEARPFMRPAFNSQKEKFKNEIDRLMR